MKIRVTYIVKVLGQ